MTEQEVLNKERRKQNRRRGLGALIRFRRLQSHPSKEPDSYHEGHLVNLSRGGACFYSEEELERGEKIEYLMTLAGSNNTIDGVARVSHAHEDAEACFIGIEFLG
jgi:hypothetical protein